MLTVCLFATVILMRILVKATLNQEAFGNVINPRPEIQDLPTVVISIGEITSSGKSHLLNMAAMKMKYEWV